MSEFLTRANLVEALKSWHTVEDQHLLSHLLLVKQARRKQGADNYPAAYRRITNEVLLDQIERLPKNDLRLGELLRTHYMDAEPNQVVANTLDISIASFYRHRDKAIDALFEKINNAEALVRQTQAGTLLNSLPPLQADRIFGATQKQDAVLTALGQSDHPHQLVLTGIGGIGKTTQLKAILARLADQLVYEHFIWTEISYAPTGRQDCVVQVMADIRRYMTSIGLPTTNDEEIRLWFKQFPCLLIIDNVEDEADANSLLKAFETWLAPSKLVMTSRAVATRHKHITLYPLDELTSADTHALIRHLAKIGSYTALQSADETTLNAIYERTGGNPLAIELVIGLLQSLPLPAILEELPSASLVETSEMYTRIYWRVWACLSDGSKRLFKMMPLVGARGAKPKQIQAVTEMDTTTFWSCISELTSRSLLIQKGNELNPRYGIHRISEQFLKVEVIQWPQ